MSDPVHALVPLKRLDEAKSRLAEALSAADRAALMQAMLGDVVAALRGASGVVRVTLVSSEASARALAAEHGVELWDDRGVAWNTALLRAMRAVVGEPCAAIVSADLPLLTAAEVEDLVRATPRRGIAVARATDLGTNAVVMRPPAAMTTCFGEPGSAQRHAEAARAAGLVAVIVDRPGTALDIDSPEDLERFLAVDRPTLTRALLTLDGGLRVRA